MTAAAIKIMPHSLEAEQSLLGGLLVDPEAINRVAGLIVPEDFYTTVHTVIFSSILDLYEKNTPIDLVTVNTALADRGQLAQIGGITYLSHLVDTMPSSANLETYAGLIKEKAVMRSVMNVAGRIQAMGFEEQEISAKEYLDRADSMIWGIDRHGEQEGWRRAGDEVTNTIQLVEDLYHKKRGVTGVSTGFADLDKLTSGLQPSDFIVIAGRPSMGKTSLALNIAYWAACSGVPAGIFSLEMSKKQLIMRLLSSETGISGSSLRTGQISESDWQKLPAAALRVQAAPLYLDDSAALNVLDIRSRARRLKKEHNVGVIFIDYLQLIRAIARGRNSVREQEISEISRSLKALAKELDIPVVALSQLNRKVEERQDKRPLLSDIRESGAIEQDADVILFIYRDEVYNKGKDDNKGIAEAIIGKQRNGPTGTVELGYVAETMRFVSLYHYEDKRHSA